MFFVGRVISSEVMLQSIPIFIMPPSWMTKINFWVVIFRILSLSWLKDGKSQSITMIKWEEMYKFKEYGGVGFSELTTFHEALILGRQTSKILKS